MRSLPFASFALASLTIVVTGCEPTPILPPDDAGRPPHPGCVALDPPPSETGVTLERVFTTSLSGAPARQLIEVVLPTSDHDGFAVTQDGRVLSFDASDSAPAALVLDLTARLYRDISESGLMSFALDPDFADNGFGYFVFTIPPAGTGRYVARIARFTFDGARFDPASERVILDVPQVDITHSVDHVGFGADGMLYVSLGDQRRTTVHAQDPSTLPGKILRLDVHGGDPYVSPPDNPFVGTGASEVYAIGLRNPWRFTVDPVDGTILVGDVGQDSREEISLLVPGGNYGWPDREGTICFLREPCEDPRYLDPLIDMTHAEIRSVVVGYRYRRSDVPALLDRVLYADFVAGSVWSFDPERRESRLEVEGRFMVTSFALDEAGHHHLTRYDPGGEGGLYRVVASTPPATTFPRLLSETGCVDPEAPRTFREGMVTFSPTSELWSDGADKDRAFAIPDGAAIGVGSDGDLELPVGSVVLKHFRYGERLHETRMLMRNADGWAGYSYRWNEAGTDAELLPSRATENLPSGVRWQYPGRSDCFTCHTTAAGVTLGLEVAQLDDAELEALLTGGYLDRRITDLAMLRAVTRDPLVDPLAPGEPTLRARSYLHANCSMCHRPGAPGRGNLDLRFETSFAGTGLCNAEPLEGRLWGLPIWDEQRLLVPGRADYSIVYLRPSLRGLFRMPPLGTDVIDEPGVAVLGEWIEGLTGCD